MLCAGFEESHLMMWSLTPRPLPCRPLPGRRDDDDGRAAVTSSDKAEEMRFLLNDLVVIKV